MSLAKQIKDDRITAMKNKETALRSTLQLVLGQLEIKKVKLKLEKVEDLSQEQTESVIFDYVKSINKEIEVYEKADKPTDKQEAEKELLLTYLPKQYSEKEIRIFVKDIVEVGKEIGDNLGRIMKFLASELKGKADMSLVKRIAKEEFDK